MLIILSLILFALYVELCVCANFGSKISTSGLRQYFGLKKKISIIDEHARDRVMEDLSLKKLIVSLNFWLQNEIYDNVRQMTTITDRDEKKLAATVGIGTMLDIKKMLLYGAYLPIWSLYDKEKALEELCKSKYFPFPLVAIASDLYTPPDRIGGCDIHRVWGSNDKWKKPKTAGLHTFISTFSHVKKLGKRFALVEDLSISYSSMPPFNAPTGRIFNLMKLMPNIKKLKVDLNTNGRVYDFVKLTDYLKHPGNKLKWLILYLNGHLTESHFAQLEAAFLNENFRPTTLALKGFQQNQMIRLIKATFPKLEMLELEDYYVWREQLQEMNAEESGITRLTVNRIGDNHLFGRELVNALTQERNKITRLDVGMFLEIHIEYIIAILQNPNNKLITLILNCVKFSQVAEWNEFVNVLQGPACKLKYLSFTTSLPFGSSPSLIEKVDHILLSAKLSVQNSY